MVSERTTVHLLRHGETAFNIRRVFRGQTDVPLNDNGREQAKMAAEYLNGRGIDRIYTSPLSRALDTANEVGRPLDLSPERKPEFAGMHFGKWQGRPHSEIRKEYPKLYRVYETAIEELEVPEGEKLSEVTERAMEGIGEIEKKHKGETILIVTHRVLIKLIFLRILGLDTSHFWQFKMDTCSLSSYEVRQRGRVLTKFNQTSYLGKTKGVTGDF